MLLSLERLPILYHVFALVEIYLFGMVHAPPERSSAFLVSCLIIERRSWLKDSSRYSRHQQGNWALFFVPCVGYRDCNRSSKLEDDNVGGGER